MPAIDLVEVVIVFVGDSFEAGGQDARAPRLVPGEGVIVFDWLEAGGTLALPGLFLGKG